MHNKKEIVSIILVLAVMPLILAGCAAQAPYLRVDSSLQKEIKVFDNVQYVPLTRLCDAYKVDWEWDPYIKSVTLKKNGTIVLRSGSDRILVKGSSKKLDRPVVSNDGAVFVPLSFVKNNLGSIVTVPVYPVQMPEKARPEALKRDTIKTIVIDAGHGGKDPGAIGRRLHIKEKILTLAISKRLKKSLESHGIKIIMTRDTDVFVSLPKRAEIANKSGADLFVSVHINASRKRSMNGFECYYLSEATDDNARAVEAMENASLEMNGESEAEHSKGLDKALWDMALTENRRESAALASYICNSVEDSLATRNRGTKTARFYVLKGTRIPGVLVEVGYISNKNEEMKLKQSNYLDKVTETLVKGILAYKEEYERTNGFTNI